MKHRLTYGFIWITILVCFPLMQSFSQEQDKLLPANFVSQCREGLTVFTDRSFYVIHENIHFTAFLQTDAYPHNAPESSVLYLELISPEGLSLAQGKYRIMDRVSKGRLPIPPGMLSGTYYLRAYTRWMRNFGEENFVYLPLHVINPFQDEVVQRTGSESKGELLPLIPDAEKVRVFTNRSNFRTGERVEVECSLQEELGISIPFGCITVVPEGAIDTASLAHWVQADSGIREKFQFRFLPDIGGIALSGRVDLKGGQESAAGVRIHFSMLGQDPDFFVARADSLGQFIVKLPQRFGMQEMFVSPDTPEDDSPEVHIDTDFSTATLPFAPASFLLDEKKRSLGSRISLHMQLERAYRSSADPVSDPEPEASSPNPFYGKPEISLEVGDFVNLPNMEEVFENLVPNCLVKQHKGAKYISIESENSMISFYEPLILVDHIPVSDPEIALAIPPSRIERIEVVPQVYVLGVSRYGGIISMFSRNGDMAGIRLPESSYFFNYMSFVSPEPPTGNAVEESGNFPDTRNTIYWSDQAALPADKSIRASFRAPSIPGSYLVLYRGVSSGGKPVYGLSRFHTVSSTHSEPDQ